MKPCALKTSEDTGQLKDKRKSARPRTDERYLKVMFLRNKKNAAKT